MSDMCRRDRSQELPRQYRWWSMITFVWLFSWQIGACHPSLPQELAQEPTKSEREQRTDAIDASIDSTSRERDNKDETPTVPESNKDTREKQPDLSDAPEPSGDATIEKPARDVADASEPTKDATPDQIPGDNQPDTGREPLTDTIPDSGPPESTIDTDATERPGEQSSENPPETPTDAPPGPCVPSTPPTTTKREWVYSDGDTTSFLQVKDIKADANGFLYLCGGFRGGQVTFGNKTIKSAGSGTSQMFVVKLNAAGALIWANTLSGTGERSCEGLVIGKAGNVFLTGGMTGSTSYGSTTISAKREDAYVAKLDPCGNVIWLTIGGGASSDRGYSLDLDAAGNVYVYGTFYGPADFGSHKITTSDVGSIFVGKLDPQGAWQWIAKGGSASPDTPSGLSVTPQGDIYIAGSSFLPVTFGTFKLNSQDPFELFIAQLNNKGTWQWAYQTKGKGRIVPYRSGLNANGRFYVTGELDGTKTFGSQTLTSPSHGDIFLAQIDNKGTFQWVLRPKGTSHLHPWGLSFLNNDIFIAGDYTGDPTFGSTKLPNTTTLKSFVTRITPSTSTAQFTWTTATKGNSDVRAQALTIGPKGDLFVAGNFQTGGTFGTISVTKKAFQFYVFVWKIPKP